MSSDINVRHPESRRRIALQCVGLLLPGATQRQRTKVAGRILAMCDKGQLKEISEDRLLDVILGILQVNRALLKDGHLEHDDHAPYFKRHLKILSSLLAEAQQCAS